MRTVIVGSGLAGVTVAEGLRKSNSNHAVTLLTSETLGVYPRPLLSHGFTRESQREKLILKTFDALRALGIQVVSGVEVQAIERAAKKIHFRTATGVGDSLEYDVLVLAQGSAAFIPPALVPHGQHFFTLNSIDDLDRVNHKRKLLREQGKKPRVSILGGGLIGCEVAADLAGAGDAVRIVHGSDRLLERILDAGASERLRLHLGGLGIDVHYNQKVDGIQSQSQSNDDGLMSLAFTQAGQPVTSEQDILLVATGFLPRVELARHAGLAIQRGVVVNGRFETDDASIYAVGDMAEVMTQADKPGALFPYVAPIRSQALHLVGLLAGTTSSDWAPPVFKPTLKVPGFKWETA